MIGLVLSQTERDSLKSFARVTKRCRQAALRLIFPNSTLHIKECSTFDQLLGPSDHLLPLLTRIDLVDTGYVQVAQVAILLQQSTSLTHLTVELPRSCFHEWFENGKLLPGMSALGLLPSITELVIRSCDVATPSSVLKDIVESFPTIRTFRIEGEDTDWEKAATRITSDYQGIKVPNIETLYLSERAITRCNCDWTSLLALFHPDSFVQVTELTVRLPSDLRAFHTGNVYILPNVRRVAFTLEGGGSFAAGTLQTTIGPSLPSLRELDISDWSDGIDDENMPTMTMMFDAIPTSVETIVISLYADEITDFMTMQPEIGMRLLDEKSIKRITFHVWEKGLQDRGLEEYFFARRMMRTLFASQGIDIEFFWNQVRGFPFRFSSQTMNPDLPAQVVAFISDYIYAGGEIYSYEVGYQTPLDRLKTLSGCCRSLRKGIVPFIFKKARLSITSKEIVSDLQSVSKALLPSVTHLKSRDFGYLHECLDFVTLLQGFTCLTDLTVVFLASGTCFGAWNLLAQMLRSKPDLPPVTVLNITVSSNAPCTIIKTFVEAFSHAQTLKLDIRGSSTFTQPEESGINNPSLRNLDVLGSVRLSCNCLTGSPLSLFSKEGLAHIVESKMTTLTHFTPSHSDNLVMPNLERLVVTSASNETKVYEKLGSFAPALKFVDLASWYPDEETKLSRRVALLPGSVEEAKFKTRHYDIVELGSLDQAALDAILGGKSLRKLNLETIEGGLQDKEEYFYRKRLFRDAFAARNIEIEMKSKQ